MRFFPVFLDLRAGTVALVGDTEAARAKLRLLRAAGARVRRHADDTDLDLSDAIAVISAAGEPIDSAVAALARSRRIPVNVVDRPELSTFIVPAIVDRGDVVVAIATGGAAPVLARRLRQRIEALLPARIGELAALMGRYRDRVAATLAPAARRRFWERVVDGPVAAAALSGRSLEAEAALARAIAAGRHAERQRGTVYLVGAGPGDPDLLTLRALHVLQSADMVFHDDAVSAAVLDRARRDATRVPVGPGDVTGQLADAARRGRQVVRLIAAQSDPGNDAAALARAGVPVVIVPGVTAAPDDTAIQEAA